MKKQAFASGRHRVTRLPELISGVVNSLNPGSRLSGKELVKFRHLISAEEPTNFRILICCGTNDDQHLMIAIDRHVDEQGQENRTDEGYLWSWTSFRKNRGSKSRKSMSPLQ